MRMGETAFDVPRGLAVSRTLGLVPLFHGAAARPGHPPQAECSECGPSTPGGPPPHASRCPCPGPGKSETQAAGSEVICHLGPLALFRAYWVGAAGRQTRSTCGASICARAVRRFASASSSSVAGSLRRAGHASAKGKTFTIYCPMRCHLLLVTNGGKNRSPHNAPRPNSNLHSQLTTLLQ